MRLRVSDWEGLLDALGVAEGERVGPCDGEPDCEGVRVAVSVMDGLNDCVGLRD